MTGIRLIVGLANPGKQYANTRHNVGAWFLHQLAREQHTSLSPESKFHGIAGSALIDSIQCRLLEPTTFMNDSGRAVRSIAEFYKISSEQILVVHDELDFEPGVVRLKKGGGHGGHNGLRDVAAYLNTSEYYRMRIGIGHPGDRHKVTSYVLGEPSKSDKDHIQHAIDEGLCILSDLVSGNFDNAMKRLHS